MREAHPACIASILAPNMSSSGQASTVAAATTGAGSDGAAKCVRWYTKNDIAEAGLVCCLCESYSTTQWGRLLKHVKQFHLIKPKDIKGSYLYEMGNADWREGAREKRSGKRTENKKRTGNGTSGARLAAQETASPLPLPKVRQGTADLEKREDVNSTCGRRRRSEAASGARCGRCGDALKSGMHREMEAKPYRWALNSGDVAGEVRRCIMPCGEGRRWMACWVECDEKGAVIEGPMVLRSASETDMGKALTCEPAWRSEA